MGDNRSIIYAGNAMVKDQALVPDPAHLAGGEVW
jgi:hypothetical protein